MWVSIYVSITIPQRRVRYTVKKLDLYAATCLGVGLNIIAFSTSNIAFGAPFGIAGIVNGHVRVDANTPLASYMVQKPGWLEAVGGTLNKVTAIEGLVTLRDGSLVLNGVISGDRLEVSDSIINGGINLGLVIQDGGIANIKNSVITADGMGMSVTLGGTANLINTKVTAPNSDGGRRAWGVGVFGGTANILQGSIVSGLENGIFFSAGRNTAGELFPDGKVVIDNSTVSSVTGATIKVTSVGSRPGETDIHIRNGSFLNSGNGRLLEVENSGRTLFSVDNSVLVGDLFADPSSTLDVRLSNSASLTGNIFNGRDLVISSGAEWRLVSDSRLRSLKMAAGNIVFSGPEFNVLSLKELSGHGAFSMRTDLEKNKGDLLEINGNAEGNHLLAIKNTGSETGSPDITPLRIVHTEGGDAQFNLLGDRVDLGAYSYLLEKQGNDWFIVGEGKTISPSTQSALALFNAAPAIWNSELTTLRSRMGEVRGQDEGGGWIRSYGNRFNASTAGGINYQQKQQGLSFGADAPIPVSNGNLKLGLMGGYSKSDLDLNRGTAGTVKSYYVGAYGTWLFDEGYYLDGVLKFNKFRNESNVAMSDGSKAKGRFNNTGVGGSVEFGKHIKLADAYFVEPYTQVSGVFVGGDSYSLTNGMKAENTRTQSVLGKVGTTAGRDFTLEDGSVVQPYVRIAMAHEFARSNDVKVNETRFDNDLFGSRAELGAGVAVSLSKRIQLHADFDYMKGKHVEQPWGANMGLTFAF